VLVRADSAFYVDDIINVWLKAGPGSRSLHTPDTGGEQGNRRDRQPGVDHIRYRNAIWDDAEQRWISGAEVAETTFTAFSGRRRAEHVTARLIMRRVRRLKPNHCGPGAAPRGELFAAYRYHAVFTDPEPRLASETTHR
jgi:hypothetical protein